MRLMRLAGVLAVLLTAALALSAQTGGDVERGRQLFLGMCSRCHGATGNGGEGPPLTRLQRAHNDEELRAIIRDGIPDRGMPRIRRFSDAELAEMAGFVRSLGQASGGASAGRAENGRSVYEKLGCASCHIVAGSGNGFGPELTGIGTRRAPEYLRQAILDPAAALPRGSAIPGRGFSEYLPVHVVMQDGHAVDGVRVNEDSFTIQIKDVAGKLYSLRKTDVKIDKQFGRSVMPNYTGRASMAEVDDLVGYLGGLGTQGDVK